jgi:hypothetical protein
VYRVATVFAVFAMLGILHDTQFRKGSDMAVMAQARTMEAR